MTLVETTRSRTRRARSAADVPANIDYLKLIRLGVWVVFCVLLVVLA